MSAVADSSEIETAALGRKTAEQKDKDRKWYQWSIMAAALSTNFLGKLTITSAIPESYSLLSGILHTNLGLLAALSGLLIGSIVLTSPVAGLIVKCWVDPWRHDLLRPVLIYTNGAMAFLCCVYAFAALPYLNATASVTLLFCTRGLMGIFWEHFKW